MAFLEETFVADELPQSERSYDLLPEGWYDATITKAEVNPTKAGTGTKIDVRYDITGPTQQGRVIFASLNIRNPSVEAERIGREQLGELMRAIGLARVQDSDELIGGNVCIKVRVKKPSAKDIANGYLQDRNEVAGWKAIGGSTAAMPKAPGASAAPASATAKPPWAK
jgi:hypothetical protein